MLNKNKKMRGKPWTGRGRGRGGDQGMDDAHPVSLSRKMHPEPMSFMYFAAVFGELSTDEESPVPQQKTLSSVSFL